MKGRVLAFGLLCVLACASKTTTVDAGRAITGTGLGAIPQGTPACGNGVGCFMNTGTGRFCVEVSGTATADATSQGGTPTIFYVASNFKLEYSATLTTATMTFTYPGGTITSGAFDWYNGSNVDIYFCAGANQPTVWQYRVTYSPNPNGYSNSGIAMDLANGSSITGLPTTGTVQAWTGGGATMAMTSRGFNVDVAGSPAPGSAQPSWFLSYPHCTGAVTTIIITEGDSLTSGVASETPYPSFLGTYLGSCFNVINVGVSGTCVGCTTGQGACTSCTTMLSEESAHMFANMSSTSPLYVLSMAGGTNDIGHGATVAQTWAFIEQWFSDMRSHCTSGGFRCQIWASTVPYFNHDNSAPYTGFIDSLNADILGGGGGAPGWDVLMIDRYNDPPYGKDGTASNTWYSPQPTYADHPGPDTHRQWGALAYHTFLVKGF